jgi:hypothetical protein
MILRPNKFESVSFCNQDFFFDFLVHDFTEQIEILFVPWHKRNLQRLDYPFFELQQFDPSRYGMLQSLSYDYIHTRIAVVRR